MNQTGHKIIAHALNPTDNNANVTLFDSITGFAVVVRIVVL